jgi:flagellar export protein FliJ
VKKFAFTLDRVLDWRRLQARIAEVQLEQLNQQRQVLESQRAQLETDKARIQGAILAAENVTGGELETWDSFRQFSDAQRKRMDQSVGVAQRQVDQQAQVVAAKRREVQLLEKLKDRRRQIWSQELDKETQQLAEETFLARWKR